MVSISRLRLLKILFLDVLEFVSVAFFFI